jgi:ATP-binding cassette, subfamily G (WHITE), member 2, PDR
VHNCYIPFSFHNLDLIMNDDDKWESHSTLLNDNSAIPYEEAEAEVVALARTMTGSSHRAYHRRRGSVRFENPPMDLEFNDPFHEVDDPRLDPLSGKFDSTLWTKAILQLQSNDPGGHPHYTAAVSLSNLNVYGYGNPTDYQKTVGNYPLSVLGMARNLFSGKGQRVNILKNFEGYTFPFFYLVLLMVYGPWHVG